VASSLVGHSAAEIVVEQTGTAGTEDTDLGNRLEA
jgi:hypothetical protein